MSPSARARVRRRGPRRRSHGGPAGRRVPPFTGLLLDVNSADVPACEPRVAAGRAGGPRPTTRRRHARRGRAHALPRQSAGCPPPLRLADPRRGRDASTPTGRLRSIPCPDDEPEPGSAGPEDARKRGPGQGLARILDAEEPRDAVNPSGSPPPDRSGVLVHRHTSPPLEDPVSTTSQLVPPRIALSPGRARLAGAPDEQPGTCSRGASATRETAGRVPTLAGPAVDMGPVGPFGSDSSICRSFSTGHP